MRYILAIIAVVAVSGCSITSKPMLDPVTEEVVNVRD